MGHLGYFDCSRLQQISPSGSAICIFTPRRDLGRHGLGHGPPQFLLLKLETNFRRNFSVTKSATIGLCPGGQTGEDCRAEGAERGEGGDKNRGYSF